MTTGWVEAEFEAIFREHYERIVRVTRRVLYRDSEAEEVCAEVFLRLYRSGPAVAHGGLVGGWLYRTATRAAIDVLRANQRRGLEEQLDDDSHGRGEADQDETQRDRADSPLGRLLRSERIAEVRAVLARLKLAKAQILLLRHSGLTYQEIAAAMEVSASSVGTMLARAEAEFASLYEQQQKRAHSTPARHRALETVLETAKEKP